MSKVKNKNISIIWDFDKTLTPEDSTTKFLSVFTKNTEDFWKEVKEISGVNSANSISTSEAPVWMAILAELAKDSKGNKISLDEKEIGNLIGENMIRFYPKALNFLEKIKNLSSSNLFSQNQIQIHHFIVTAGLTDLVSSVLKFHKKREMITEIFGCRYKALKKDGKIDRNIPIYCMDKTAKTRALFEISKGCFQKDSNYKVDDLVADKDYWCPFENIIYVGDGDTDIPAFSLVKSRKGMTIGVYNQSKSKEKINKQAKNMRKGERIDLFVPADFSENGDLFKFVKARCERIAKRYEAHLSS